jgi:sugar/nucleoside kinase (ribokinase family)
VTYRVVGMGEILWDWAIQDFIRLCPANASAPEVTCVDAVEAGDAFSAALVKGLLIGQSLESVAARANRIGAYGASQAGAMPPIPPEYMRP